MKPAVAAALAAFVLAEVVSADAARPQFTPTSIQAPFIEQFTPDWSERWQTSQASKFQKEDDTEAFKYDGVWSVEEPEVFPGLAGDAGLVLKSKAKQHAISHLFEKPIDPKGKPLVVQYEVKLQKGLGCGGAYLKLLSATEAGVTPEEFSDKTPYTIMFGPDKCGQTNKVHFIFRHKNPKTGEFEEKHVKYPAYPKLSKTTALYTLVVQPDQTFEIFINNDSKKKGSLLEDFEPAVNPEAEIDDPNDTKPADWVEQAKITDPSASKPEDWDEDAPLEIPDEDAVKPEGWLEDEPLTIPDPDAQKPEEWDDEEDGEWFAPSIPNPKCEAAAGCGPWVRPVVRNPAYKGKWSAPLIDNPDYKGVWAPRKIANPNYFEDKSPADFNPIGGVGFELWTMDEDILFDNIYIGHDPAQAKQFAAETFDAKIKIEQGKEDEEKATAEKAAEAAAEKAAGFVGQVQSHVNTFIARARQDPVEAIKEMPQVAGGLGAAFAGLLGLVGLLGGLMGSGAKEAAKDGKKVDAPKGKSKEVTASAKTTAVQAKEPAKKRPTAAKVDDAEDDE